MKTQTKCIVVAALGAGTMCAALPAWAGQWGGQPGCNPCRNQFPLLHTQSYVPFRPHVVHRVYRPAPVVRYYAPPVVRHYVQPVRYVAPVVARPVAYQASVASSESGRGCKAQVMLRNQHPGDRIDVHIFGTAASSYSVMAHEGINYVPISCSAAYASRVDFCLNEGHRETLLAGRGLAAAIAEVQSGGTLLNRTRLISLWHRA
jgi:hypothetical protein